MVRRGQLWWAGLPVPQSSEPGFTRPVLVIQSDTFNISKINTVIVVAITSNTSLARAPGNVLLPLKKTGLTKESVANVSQILTLDKRFLQEMIGELDLSVMRLVDEGIRLVLDL